MANSKIVYGDTTLIDLTQDTATSTNDVADGYTFFLPDGTSTTGTGTFGTGATVSGNDISIAGTVTTWTPPEWATCTDAEINEAIAYHNAGKIYLPDVWSKQPAVDWATCSDELFERALTLNEQGYFDINYLHDTWSAQTGASWSSGTDKQIVRGLDLAYSDLLDLNWAVGDTRSVSLSAMSATSTMWEQSAQTVTYVLSNKGGKNLVTPINGHTECLYQVDQVNILSTDEPWGRNTSLYESSYIKPWLNETYRNAVPSTIRNIFKQFVMQVANTTTTLVDSQNYFALRCAEEVTGNQIYSNISEGAQVTYYTTASNRIKKKSGSAYKWWLRTSRGFNSNYEVRNINSAGNLDYNMANGGYGIAPFTVI